MTKPNTGDVKVQGHEGRKCPVHQNECWGPECMWYRRLRYEVNDALEGRYTEMRGDCVLGHYLHILRDTAHFTDQAGVSMDKMRGIMQKAALDAAKGRAQLAKEFRRGDNLRGAGSAGRTIDSRLPGPDGPGNGSG